MDEQNPYRGDVTFEYWTDVTAFGEVDPQRAGGRRQHRPDRPQRAPGHRSCSTWPCSPSPSAAPRPSPPTRTASPGARWARGPSASWSGSPGTASPWSATPATGASRPSVERVVVRIIPDNAARFQVLRSGTDRHDGGGQSGRRPDRPPGQQPAGAAAPAPERRLPEHEPPPAPLRRRAGAPGGGGRDQSPGHRGGPLRGHRHGRHAADPAQRAGLQPGGQGPPVRPRPGPAAAGRGRLPQRPQHATSG